MKAHRNLVPDRHRVLERETRHPRARDVSTVDDHRRESVVRQALQRMIDHSPQQPRLRAIKAMIQRRALPGDGQAPARLISPNSSQSMVLQRQPRQGNFEKAKGSYRKFQAKKVKLMHDAAAWVKGVWHGRGWQSRYQELDSPTEADFLNLERLDAYLDRNLRSVNHPQLNQLRKAVKIALKVGAQVGGHFSGVPGTSSIIGKLISKLDTFAKTKLQEGPIPWEAMPLLGSEDWPTSTEPTAASSELDRHQHDMDMRVGPALRLDPDLEALIEAFIVNLERERSEEAGQRVSSLSDIGDIESDFERDGFGSGKREDEDNPFGKT